ncbi:MAG TPA: hypothetical protein VK841_20520 [Polyangiaceae bacterium]|nr:hypothetical protein [Polyangiaceae bacterium]
MRSPFASRWAKGLFTLAALGLAACASGCTSSGDKPSSQLGTSNTFTPDASAVACTGNEPGCPCSPDGTTVACGHVVYRSADYVSCSMGQLTCASGKWSTCVGDQVVTMNLGGAGLKLLSQPQGAPAPTDCDPLLNAINSNIYADIPADAGVTTTDAGVQITGVPQVLGSCTALTVTPSAPPGTNLLITQVGTPPTPNSLQFTATLAPPGCFPGTPPSPIWTVSRPDVATMSPGGLLLLQFTYAGPMNVTAYLGTLSATVTVNVTVNALDLTGVGDSGTIANQFSSSCMPVDAGTD